LVEIALGELVDRVPPARSRPRLGSGGLEGAEGREAIAAALLAGYRLIDTALFYNTEQEIAGRERDGVSEAAASAEYTGNACHLLGHSSMISAMTSKKP
jgi:aryl-alcohol dehydrogenase-like predicted oxidoreductase